MAKKIFTCLFCFIFLLSLSFISSFPVFYKYGKQNLIIYYGSNSSNCKERKYDFCALLEPNKTGERFICAIDEINVEEFFSEFKAEPIFSEEITEGISYYAYSKKIPYYKIVCGKKINLHIFLGKENCVIGTPLIFGSF